MERETKQQKQIYEVLEECKSHPTLLELTHLVKEKYPNIGQATVYRFVRRYMKRGIVMKLSSFDEDRYDINVNHQHFQCVCCGKIEDVFLKNDVVSLVEDSLKDKKVLNAQILVQGICDDCKEKYEEEM